MIKRTLSLALLLLGAQTAMAAAEINLGELVTATHDEEWQPVELEEDGVASMKPLLRAFTPKSEASFELLWKKEPKDGLEPYEAMVENCGDPIADASGKRVWRYDSPEKTGGGVYSCQRLPNGNTLIGENSTGRVFELTPQGEQLKVIQVPLNAKDRHQTLRMVRRLPNGDTLVCRSGAGIVEIYGPDLRKKWSQQVPGLAFAAVPDPAGNIYIASLDRIQLWSPKHELLWEFVGAESGLPIKNMTGLHLLPSGNLVVGCYAYGKGGVGAFEINPRKTILWRYAAPNRNRDSHMAVQLLDPALPTPTR